MTAARNRVSREEDQLRSKLQLKLSDLNAQIVSRDNHLANLEDDYKNKIAALKIERDGEVKRLELVQKRTGELFQEQESYKHLVKRYTDEVAELKPIVKQLKESQILLIDDKNNLEERIVELGVRESSLADNITNLQNKIKDTLLDLNKVNANIDTAKDDLRKLEHEKVQALNDISKVRADAETIQSELAKRALSLDKREESVAMREAAIQSLEKRVAAYNRFIKL